MRLMVHGQAVATSKVYEAPRVSFVGKVLYINTVPVFRLAEVNLGKPRDHQDCTKETILRCQP